MDLAFLPALSVLLGSATGALTSVATTWLAHRHQQRSQWMTQERARRERIFSEFIDQASKMFADALTHTSLEDPTKFVPLYATMGKLRLFSSKRTISTADAVMSRILETYYLPNTDFKTQPSRPDQDFDILSNFILACRAELKSDSTESDGNQENVHQGRRAGGPLACALLAVTVLGGCDDRAANSVRLPTLVRTETVRLQDRPSSVTLTGDVRARISADLSFRVSGRVIARLVDVGAHVNAGDVLVRIDPTEQQADVDAETAAVAAAESQVQVAASTFNRQKTLISDGFTTRVAFDQAQEGLLTAQSSLEDAKAQLGTAKDALGCTELRAGAAGVITARNIEVGQVVQAAQPAFTLAQDGDRDAVFDVYESIFFREPEDGKVVLTLLSDRNVTAVGRVREVSPTIDPKSFTVRVKVAIENPPAAMTLGSAVAGTVRWKPVQQIVLPWSALMSIGSAPAVWVVGPATKTVSLKPVTVDSYQTGTVVIKGGLQPGERVVVDGGKLLSLGQSVTYDREGAS